MEMDCNLKKLGQLFQRLPYTLYPIILGYPPSVFPSHRGSFLPPLYSRASLPTHADIKVHFCPPLFLHLSPPPTEVNFCPLPLFFSTPPPPPTTCGGAVVNIHDLYFFMLALRLLISVLDCQSEDGGFKPGLYHCVVS